MKTIYKSCIRILLFVVSVLIVACGSPPPAVEEEVEHEESDSKIEFSAAQIESAGIVLGGVETRPISGAIKANGLLDVPPQQEVSVSVAFGGFLKSTSLLQGSRVSKGQLIAVIENSEYIQFQQDYLEARNQLEYTEADFERQKRLAEENVNAQKTLQQAKSNYQSWLAKKNGLQARLKMLNIPLDELEKGNITSTVNIYAPIDGFVTKVNVNIGKFVNPTDVLFQIVNTEHLHAELIIFEKDIPKIKIGQKVRFTLANENQERMATVYLIGREIGEDRTIRIHCHIDREDTNLLPGAYLQAFVEAGEMKVDALPDEAIVDFQNTKFIFISNATDTLQRNNGEGTGSQFTMVEIKTGSSESGYTQVFLPGEWNANNKVVVKGAYAILSKAKNNEDGEEHGH